MGRQQKIIKSKRLVADSNTQNNVLLIMIGIPGSGKSTWVKENGLSDYTISSDALRLLHVTPLQNVSKNQFIDMSSDKRVWSNLYDILEHRMNKGIFTVVDATHTITNYLQSYVELAEKYNYTVYYKYMNSSLETCVYQNQKRSGICHVPAQVIVDQHERLSELVIPESFIKINEVSDLPNTTKNVLDVTEKYESIYVIGDIQGCSKQLNEFLEKHYSEKSLYVFVGDLCDRGYDNAGVLETMFVYSEKENVILIEGNHELYLRSYVNQVKVDGYEFTTNTLPQIQHLDIQKIANVLNKLKLFVTLQLGNKRILVTHGGVSQFTDFLDKKQCIRGVGNYEDHSIVDKLFEEESSKYWRENAIALYSVHGHRNCNLDATKVNNVTYNLEGQVEFGGSLRVVKFTKGATRETGTIETIEIKNNSDVREKHERDQGKVFSTFKENPLVHVKDLGDDLYSINFKREAFYKGIWDSVTMKARGLFITNTGSVIARSYDKFFNINEHDDTKINNLSQTLGFPVQVYTKYNGFLGIVSEYKDKVMYFSKSTNTSEFSALVKKQLEPYEAKLKKYTEKGYSLIFEICDYNDIHIVHEDERPVLLDAIKNQLNFEKMSYSDLCEVAKDIGLEVKKLETTLTNTVELEKFIDTAMKQHKGEGYVLEGTTMTTKLKTYYYRFWKEVRSDVRKYNNVDNKREYLHPELIQIFTENIPEFETKSMPELAKYMSKHYPDFDYTPVTWIETDDGA